MGAGFPAAGGTYAAGRTARDRRHELLDAMFDAGPDLLVLTTLDGTVVRVNAAWQRLLGWTEPELVGTKLADLRHPDDGAAASSAMADALDDDIPADGRQFRYRDRDGRYRWLQWTGAVLPDQALIVATGRDVTGAVQAEQALVRTIAVQREITAVARDREAVLGLIAERTLQVMPAGDTVMVQLLDPRRAELRVVSSAGVPEGTPIPPAPLDGSLAGLAVTSGEPVRCDDTGTDPRTSGYLSRITATRSLIVAPVRGADGEPLGSLTVTSARRYAFSAGDEHQLTLLADTLSGALR